MNCRTYPADADTEEEGSGIDAGKDGAGVAELVGPDGVLGAADGAGTMVVGAIDVTGRVDVERPRVVRTGLPFFLSEVAGIVVLAVAASIVVDVCSPSDVTTESMIDRGSVVVGVVVVAVVVDVDVVVVDVVVVEVVVVDVVLVVVVLVVVEVPGGRRGPVTLGSPMNSKCMPSGKAHVPPHAKP